MRVLAIVLALASMTGSPVAAEDVPISGRYFRVEDPLPGKNDNQRTLRVTARDRLGRDLTGDPRVTGVTVEVFASGDASSANQVFVVPAGSYQDPNGPGWSGRPARCKKGRCRTRFGYSDARGENGPITRLRLDSYTGRWTRLVLRAESQGNNATIEVVPPNPGARAGVIVSIPDGSRVCTLFDVASGSSVSENTAEKFWIGGGSTLACPAPGS